VRSTSFRLLAGAALATAALVVAACGSSSSSSGAGGSTSSGTSGSSGTSSSNAKIALLLPESKTTRYESADRPIFTARLKQICPNCQLIYSNADQDASKQQSQAEAAITNGAKVLVLDPVDAASAAAIVTKASQSHIPVLAYDRLIPNAKIAGYISFDNTEVGKLQASSLLKALGTPNGKSIVMINGAPTDNNAKLFKQGALSVLDKSGVKIAKSYDTPDWSPDQAQTEMQQAITAIGATKINGVYAANDGTAGGAIAAMKGGGVNPKKVPTTGQDAELAAIQRILIGDQYMTVYKSYKQEATRAADMAVELAQGKPLTGTNQKVNNGTEAVPSVILTPVAVTSTDKKSIANTVLKDKLYTVNQICSGQYASACKAAGIM
jgi:D-xylose transport system substrate-binding protein